MTPDRYCEMIAEEGFSASFHRITKWGREYYSFFIDGKDKHIEGSRFDLEVESFEPYHADPDNLTDWDGSVFAFVHRARNSKRP